MTTLEQVRTAEAIVEATVVGHDYIVLEDGYPITELILAPTRSWYVGTAGEERLRLPGGYRLEKWIDADFPRIEVGTTLLVFARRGKDGVLLLKGGSQSLFFAREGTAGWYTADVQGFGVVDPGCDERRLVALPAQMERLGDDGLPQRPAPGVMFVDDPTLAALDWSLFIDEIDACVAFSTMDGGAQ